ncbi:hypothetical protein QQF64_032437 [Cirrhinus molitorella]|uniref:Uncharacterized protein n=1 Tax=Cirrhinus molitorella TaxID=172907 RepID=A0ABR3MZV2_9TELE
MHVVFLIQRPYQDSGQCYRRGQDLNSLLSRSFNLIIIDRQAERQRESCPTRVECFKSTGAWATRLWSGSRELMMGLTERTDSSDSRREQVSQQVSHSWYSQLRRRIQGWTSSVDRCETHEQEEEGCVHVCVQMYGGKQQVLRRDIQI